MYIFYELSIIIFTSPKKAYIYFTLVGGGIFSIALVQFFNGLNLPNSTICPNN